MVELILKVRFGGLGDTPCIRRQRLEFLKFCKRLRHASQKQSLIRKQERKRKAKLVKERLERLQAKGYRAWVRQTRREERKRQEKEKERRGEQWLAPTPAQAGLPV